MRVRKQHTGSSSHGHEWTEPGQVLDIPAEDAAELVAIAPGEFEVLPDLPEEQDEGDEDQGEGSEGAPEGDGEGPGSGAAVDQEPVTEPEPLPEPEPEEAKPARGRRKVTEA